MPKQKKTEKVEISVAKIALIGTIVTGLLGFAGVFVTQYFQGRTESTETQSNSATSSPTPFYVSNEGEITFEGITRSRFHSGVQVRDFLVKATFFAPYSQDKGNWDIGIFFGEDSLVVVKSSSEWSLRPSGDILNLPIKLSLEEGSPTSLTLMVYNGSGCLFVNNSFVADLDLSTTNTLGEISLVTNNFDGDSLPNQEATIKFSNFEIHAIDSLKCH